jgi:16S rRNA (adenine1518-N6/adenine1519-N6)-dimethyltransferase
MYVRPKKHLGQHFLTDESVAQRIADSVLCENTKNVVEIGPGTGVLTKYLLQRADLNLRVIELDSESVLYLAKNYPELKGRIVEGDFLRMSKEMIFHEPFVVAGNFPYNISSQILFRVLDFKDAIPEVTGMFQKEVAQRIASPPGNKDYGIISVLLQAWYDIEYLFTVDEHVFNPPPKVKSGVIRLKRNATKQLACDEVFFKQVVKTAFNQRRKTLRNSLKQLIHNPDIAQNPIFNQRPEQLSVEEFIKLSLLLYESH